jgi:hypothetical protein
MTKFMKALQMTTENLNVIVPNNDFQSKWEHLDHPIIS